jgi:hypothetical protein
MMVPTLRVGIYPLTLRVIPWQTQSVWNGVTTLSVGTIMDRWFAQTQARPDKAASSV